ncbi:Fe(3+) ABC transporter substrate-binding protein [Providencia rettgeri]|uniref:Fe(3+) ABC transporter substrate-binding protein n=1 Tax=Alcaligenes parafaecalis TaxID=171260 RepID=A0ABT3VMC6_9BURK|nr:MULTISPECIES: Fe(3+) ABC transporter substrate-binding protein [Alcaligenes]MBY6346156.1 Fe(3+) ABC transporter substrate-binding protein [Providencia rettgeri]MCX5463256.1 Fe(3+) ABC transporter substrate-binding protein [Alcaligenes parafaecalis]QTC00690.1 Fe(3+) ABC transporter substrate-binding protein [Alcaligenes sp. SORT26]
MRFTLRSRALTQALLLSAMGTMSMAAFAAGEVNLYTTREPGLITPLLETFSKDTGVKVNTVFVKDGLIERVKTEGDKSPADILMTVDIGNLLDLVEAGITQPVNSAELDSAIPANLRGEDKQWYSLSLRDRVAYVAKDVDVKSIHYEDFADPKWKGKVCIRSGQHPYNTALVAAMIAHNGAEATEQWLRGVKDNLGRKAAGGDRDVARDILGGICDVGIANAYYVGRMKNAEPGSDSYKWGEAINVVRPTFADTKGGGTHVNISGAAVAKHAPNKDNAVKLLEYLVSEKAQSLYAKANYEYPVRAGVELDPVVASFGPMTIDPLPLTEIAKHRKQASELVDKVGFDN